MHECAWGDCGRPEAVVYVYRSQSGRTWVFGACEHHDETREPSVPPGFDLVGIGGDPDVVRGTFTDGS